MVKTDSAESAEGPGCNRGAGQPLKKASCLAAAPGTCHHGPPSRHGALRPTSAHLHPGFPHFDQGQQPCPQAHSGPWGKRSQGLARLVLGK